MLASYQINVEKEKERDIDKSFILLTELSAFQNFKHCLHIITCVERGDVGDPGATVSFLCCSLQVMGSICVNNLCALRS